MEPVDQGYEACEWQEWQDGWDEAEAEDEE